MQSPPEPVEEYRAPKDHKSLKQMVESHLDLTQTNAGQAKLDRDYYDGDQISTAMRAELAKRGQPAIYINKITSAINGMFGILDAAASDPEAFPRNPKSRDAADVATKVLRFLSDKADLKSVKRECSSNFIVEGCTAALIEFDGKVPTVTALPWDEFIYDPLSKKHNFRDAEFLGVAKLMNKKGVKALYPEYDESGDQTDDFGFFNDDTAKSQYWGSRDRKLVRVVDLYYFDDGAWHRAVFTGSQTLFTGPSSYTNEDGETFCPIEATSYEVSRSGDRYGAVRHMRPLQDSLNARSSRLLHLVNHRQVKQTALNAPQGNRAIAVREAAKADGAIPFGWDSVAAPDLAQGQMMILQQTMADLDRMAPTPAILGRLSGANESGRARQILQQAGYTELARSYARFEAFEAGIYRKLWLCAREYLTEPTYVRITNDPRAIEMLLINEPVMGQVGRVVTDPETGEPLINPMTGQPEVEVTMGVVGQNNRLAELDVDIILSTVPDTVTLEQESFNAILEYASATGVSPFQPEFKALIEMSPMPNKREIIERLDASMQQMGGNEPDPMQLEAAKTGLDAQKAKTERDRAKAFKDITAAQAEQAAMVRAAMGHGPSNPAF